jgi:hypothetical protein
MCEEHVGSRRPHKRRGGSDDIEIINLFGDALLNWRNYVKVYCKKNIVYDFNHVYNHYSNILSNAQHPR